MNFWSDSVKIKSPTQNEHLFFEFDTPRGHFFAVLHFASNDFANLDATLKRKLETIVGSFDSVTSFSTDLFLSFLAKEINNFLHDLGEQTGGPQLFCNGSLCLLNGNRLAYFLFGDATLKIPGHSSLEISTKEQRKNRSLEKLGVLHWDGPLTARVPAVTLNDDDVVLLSTGGLEEEFGGPEISTTLQNLASPDSKSIVEALLKNDQEASGRGTLLVISGPYDKEVDYSLADLTIALGSLEEKVKALAESGHRDGNVPYLTEGILEAELEQRINPQIEELKEGLKGKANSLDILEFNEILRNLGVVLAGKADTADVLTLQRDILKLGIASNENQPHRATVSENEAEEISRSLAQVENGNQAAGWDSDSNFLDEEDHAIEPSVEQSARQRSFSLQAAFFVFIVAAGGVFAGAWLQSRVLKKNPEVWSVKTAGNQIWINRLDQGGQGNVTLNVAIPLRSRGEQTFSSFADVKRYIDTITAPQPSSEQSSYVSQAQPVENKQLDTVAKAIANHDDSSKHVSPADKKNTQKLPEPKTAASTKPEIRTTRVALTSSAPALATAAQRDRRVSANPTVTTTQMTVAEGDTLEKVARRYKTTPGEIRKLNPRINDRGVIQPRQKIVVPALSSTKNSKG